MSANVINGCCEVTNMCSQETSSSRKTTPSKSRNEDPASNLCWKYHHHFWLLFFSGCFGCYTLISLSFLAPNLIYTCHSQNVSLLMNESMYLEESSMHSSVLTESKEFDPRCEILDLPTENTEGNNTFELHRVKCTKWKYDLTFYKSTIIDEWDLVCDREWLISFSQTGVMVGNTISVIVFGFLADRFGRKPLTITGVLCMMVSILSSAFSYSFIQFAISRFVFGLSVGGLYLVAFVLLMEASPEKHRPLLTLGSNFGWSLGYSVLPGIAYALRNWRYIILAPIGPLIILFIYNCCAVPESARWLLARRKRSIYPENSIQNGRIKKEKPKNYVNGAAVVQNINDELTEKEEIAEEVVYRSGKITIITVLKSQNLRKKVIILWFIWFVSAFIYFGLSLNTNELGDNIYISCLISGLVEFPAHVLCILIVKRFGRRSSGSALLIVAGIAYLVTTVIPVGFQWLHTSLAMVGKFCVTAVFCMLFLYTAELFPTVTRSVVVGSGSTWARIGSILAPFVKEIGRAMPVWFIPLIFGTAGISSGALILLLPETRGMKIPDTIEEAENLTNLTNNNNNNNLCSQKNGNVKC